MSTPFTDHVEKLCKELAFESEGSEIVWNFRFVEKYIIHFKPVGFLDEENFGIMQASFAKLVTDYFKEEDFLIFLFDFTDFKKATPKVRTQIIEGKVFANERITFVLYGMNYFISTMAKIISNNLISKRLFVAKTEEDSLVIAKKLIVNYRNIREKQLRDPKRASIVSDLIDVRGFEVKIVSKQAWRYEDPSSDYTYKIDLIDHNILVSKPSGYIRYQNSVMANVLFDKVVNNEIGSEKKYYRIQDYTGVEGSENKARRDFTSYIINGIDQIDLLVFCELNRIMRTVVRLGMLVHPSFHKVRIADTFEDALELVIDHKYKSEFESEKNKQSTESSSTRVSSSEEIVKLKAQLKEKESENEMLIQDLFNRISQISYGKNLHTNPILLEENHPFYDLYSAIQLLDEDFTEIKNERDSFRAKYEKMLLDHAQEIKHLTIRNESLLKEKDAFIRSSGHELNGSLEAILNAIQLLKQEENPDNKKAIFDIIKMASVTLQDGIEQLKSSISDFRKVDFVTDNMFNYRKNILQVVEVATMSQHTRRIVFENTIEEGIPTFLVGDKRKFNQIVTIFFENALKYTNDGFIKVHTHLVKKTANQTRIRVSVSDSGIGIDNYTKTKLFSEESKNTQNENIKGFGLLIAKTLSKVINATLGFESAKGEGSSFWIEITFNDGYHDKKSQMYAVRDSRKVGKKNQAKDGSKALLILDDILCQNLLEQILRKNGIQSKAKYNFQSLDEIEGTFDYAFVSLQLTGSEEIASFQLLKNALFEKNNFKPMVCIACVDSLMDPIVETYRKMGADYFLKKPLHISDLEQLLAEIK
ncbi:MAG: hypothetical protein JW729_02025 [Bacteroidales bacterium]|nr:hypothetical protein [Bacteroidales bacterium]